MKRFLIASAASLIAISALAQTQCNDPLKAKPSDIVKVTLDARVDFQQVWNDATVDDANSGFEGKYLMLRVDGSILPGLTYSWRQRFNKKILDGNFFDATDWIYLNYNYKGWDFSGGKNVIAIGGWEYDANPINVYDYSAFTNNIRCYGLAASVGYNFTSSDFLKFQVSQSPFFTPQNRNMYAYNLFYDGHHDFFHALYSLNLLETTKSHYISYISLGNRFEFNKFTIDLDLMNRASSHQTFFFKDCSVVGKVSYKPTKHWNIFAKYSYDVNHSGNNSDFCVFDGTEISMIGGGVEYFPLRKKIGDLRLHADCFYSWGKNSNTDDMMQNKTTFLNVGLTWFMNVYNLKRKCNGVAKLCD